MNTQFTKIQISCLLSDLCAPNLLCMVTHDNTLFGFIYLDHFVPNIIQFQYPYDT